MAVEMYVQDHDEVLPISYVAAQGAPRPSWREAVQPYVLDRDILVCPAAEHRGPKAAELPLELRATYALNAWLSPPDLTAVGGSRGEPLPIGAVANPAATILLCDAGYSNVPVALDLDHYLALGMQEQVLPTPRHQEAANFAFVDGHVRKMTEPATRVPEYLWDTQ
jgi:prepilin-type processing-associated H-X9-DG protein